MTPELKARVSIDALLVTAGWHVCNVSYANIHAATGVAIREFPLNSGFVFFDDLRYVNGKACGLVQAKIEEVTLLGADLNCGDYRNRTQVTGKCLLGGLQPRVRLPSGEMRVPVVTSTARFGPT